MGTRLKNIEFSVWFKLLAAIIGIVGIVLGFYGFMKFPDYKYGVQNKDYIQSAELKDKVNSIESLITSNFVYESEENIKSGEAIDDSEIKVRINNLKSSRNNEMQDITNEYEYHISNNSNNDEESKRLRDERDKRITELKEDYDNQISVIKEVIITERLARFNERKKLLEGYKGLYYSVVEKGIIVGQSSIFYKSLPYFSKSGRDADLAIYIGFEKEEFARQSEEYSLKHENGSKGIFMLISGLLLILLSIIWFAFTAGRDRENEEIKLKLLDKIYLDMGFGITLAIVIACAAIVIDLVFSVYRELNKYDVPLFYIGCISLMIIAYVVFIAYVITLAKRIKRGEFLKHTLIYKVFTLMLKYLRTVFAGVKNGLNAGPLATKLIAFLILYNITIMINVLILWRVRSFVAFVIFVSITIGTAYLLSKRLSGFKILGQGVKRVKGGDLSYKIPPCGSYTIDSIAEDINNISEGLKGAVEKEMRAEHMKVELITNVSHDLKTPLTSIITYTDLLSQDNITPEETKEYIGIIKSKSEKLNHLIEDLFEVSKAESRTTPLVLEKLCLNDLITQSYVEYEDSYIAAKLEVKLNIPQEKIMVLADGSKMWRVLSNIFNNTLKYSLSGTRIYIDVELEPDNASVTFKNISNYGMNFKADEIVERFKRGDESRTGEGSGLGLAIVKSFMSLQNGKCDITVDGDLFKIKLTLNLI